MEQTKEDFYIHKPHTTIRLSNKVNDIIKKSNILFYEKSFNSMVNNCIAIYVLDFLKNLENKDEELLKYCEYIVNKSKREKIIDLRVEEKRKLFLRQRIVKDIGLYAKHGFGKKAFIDMLELYKQESVLYADNDYVTERINDIIKIVKSGKKSNLKEVGDTLYKEKVELR